MPRALYFFDFEDTGKKKLEQKLFKISGIDDSLSCNRYLLKDSKKCTAFRLSPKVIPEKFLYDAYISKHLAPFSLHMPTKVMLPAKRDNTGWVALTDAEITNWSGVRSAFSEIKSAYNDQYNKDVALAELLQTIDSKRKKLTQDQKDILSGFLVLFGAGGSNPCASYVSIEDLSPEKLVIDQTLYWAKIESEEEAVYLTGIINSSRIKEIISEFQPKGQQGERHIHKLPLKAIPDFDSGNEKHIDIVDKTKALISEWEEYINHNSEILDLLDPNKALSYRRKNIWRKIRTLDSFDSYDRATKLLFQ